MEIKKPPNNQPYPARRRSEFGKWLDAIRLRRGLTVRQLTERAGVCYVSYTKLVTGDATNPTLWTVVAIAKALKLSGNDVFGRYYQSEMRGKERKGSKRWYAGYPGEYHEARDKAARKRKAAIDRLGTTP